MKRSRLKPADSLDLLLDTMCNTFGGIILIAILVALIARDNPISPLAAAQKATGEMIERRLATALADLAAARTLRDGLTTPADPQLVTALGEKRAMEGQIAQLEAEGISLSATTDSQAKNQASDPGVQIKEVLAEQRRLAQQATEIQNALRAQEQNSARLKARLTELDSQISKEQNDRIVKLRFPKERAKTKGSFPIIVKFGKVYPLHDETRNRNEQSIAWKAGPGDGRISLPIKTAGWDMKADRGSIDRLLSKLRGEDLYLAFYVYPDSFSAFRELRDAAATAGWEFGIDLEPPGADLIWGSNGTTPPPL